MAEKGLSDSVRASSLYLLTGGGMTLPMG